MAWAAAQTALVADMHPLSLDSLARVVKGLGIEVIARETRIDRVAALVTKHDPDLLVLGVDAVDIEVQELLHKVQRTHPELRLVVISEDDLESARVAFAAGAHAYCGRTASIHDLAAAIRQSFERSIHLRPLETEAYPGFPYLTRREAEILGYVAEGRTNKQIARTLWLSLNTVKFHLSNIYRKLNVANRAHATHWAEQHGLLDKRLPTGADRRREDR
jgi:DNA-binding NarL/FixJ family response regulator